MDDLLSGTGEAHVQHSVIEVVLLQSRCQSCHLGFTESDSDDWPFTSLSLVHGHARDDVRLIHPTCECQQPALLDSFPLDPHGAELARAS